MKNENCRPQASGPDDAARSSAFRLPPSAFHLGISLTEVLIAMGIMTVGLLGVASVFPVGGWQMQKAEIADRGAAVAQDAMSRLITTGMLDPRSWFTLTPAQNTASPSDPNYNFIGVDGKFLIPSGAKANTYTRPVAAAIDAANRMNLTQAQKSAILGHVYVIDPLGIAAIGQKQDLSNRYAYAVPSSAYLVFPGGDPNYYALSQWNNWKTTGYGSPIAQPKALTWPIRRVTFRQPSTGFQVDRGVAEMMCMGTDDVAYDFPERADRPAIQSWDITTDNSGNTIPLARKWTGDYSWLATVAPTTCAARDGMPTSPGSFAFDVSVVVFYKRILPSAPVDDPSEAMQTERSVAAKVMSTGPSGGELFLWDTGDNKSTSAFTNLKTGNWIMLCGPHPASNDAEPRFFMNWYQVIAIDKEQSAVITNPTTQRVVSLRGPEWPWKPAQRLADSDLSNDLCVGIFKGAVAVHSKTLRLEDMRSAGLPPMGLTGNVPAGTNVNLR